jgi:multisubunit Na+/H+ antiporter MnhG subunit
MDKDTQLSDLVRAQNRTTAAVRSIAVFLFMNLVASVAGGLIVGLGYLTQAVWMLVIGALVFLAGLVLSLLTALAELKFSDN